MTPLFHDVWIYMIGLAGNGLDAPPLIPSISGNDSKLECPTMPGERFDIQTSPDLGAWTNAVSDLFASAFLPRIRRARRPGRAQGLLPRAAEMNTTPETSFA